MCFCWWISGSVFEVVFGGACIIFVGVVFQLYFLMCFYWWISVNVFGVVFSGACTTHFSVLFRKQNFQCVFVGGFRAMFLRLFWVVLATFICRCGFSMRFYNVFLLVGFG
jgi:hypothetical protein